MIKDGMWFDSIEHYRYWLERTKEVDIAFNKVTIGLFKPLTERLMKLLQDKTITYKSTIIYYILKGEYECQ